MHISLIAAMTLEGRVIGSNNRLPWHLPADLYWFKQHTLHKPLLMGRKTYQSIGHPLANRHNIVLSHKSINHDQVTTVHTIDEAVSAAGAQDELMVIGGESLYRQLLPKAKRLYLSLIEAKLAGDAFFPDYSHITWHTVLEKYRVADKTNLYPVRFMILETL